jgi:hypothetical protein
MITYLDLSDPLIKQSQILVDFTLKKDKLDQIEEYKGVKQAIGQFHHSTPFTNHLLPVEDGDRFFLFSDGFADQFGGENLNKLLDCKQWS